MPTPRTNGSWVAQFDPVPGRTAINEADKPREGDGRFGTPRTGGPHKGIDIEAEVGRSVVAIDDGRVVRADGTDKFGYGNQVSIDHNNGYASKSAHLDSLSVNTGDDVLAGQEIGKVGRSGNTPPGGDTHVHVEISIGTDRTGRGETYGLAPSKINNLPVVSAAS